ncbi:MAG: protein serine/threonine phosphatase [Bacteroidetes bacterium]|nr:protein serine/threonine phosphatase [Bacteroidota bacterium]
MCFSVRLTAGKADSLARLLQGKTDTAYVQLACAVADAYIDENNAGRGFNYIDSALNRANAIRNEKFRAYAYNYAGNLYNYVGDVTKALESFEKALKINQKIGNAVGQRSVYLNRGNTFFNNSDYPKAEASYKLALTLNSLIHDDRSSLADIYNNLGSVNAVQLKFDAAKEYFTKAMAINIATRDSASIAYACNNLGLVEYNQGHYDKAMPYFKQALELKLKFGSSLNKAEAYVAMANLYEQMHEPAKELAALQSSLSYTDTAVYNEHLKGLYLAFASFHEKHNNIPQAYHYYKLLHSINSDLFKKEVESQIQQKELMFSLASSHLNDSLVQVAHIEKQGEQIKRSNTIRYFLLLIVVLVLIFLLLLYKRFRISQLQKKEITRQKMLVDEKQKEILDSITYAKRIQQALLNENMIREVFSEHFIFFQPKDIVSGDFYWSARIREKEELVFIAVCDSTGHGVPGAFMSLLNSNFLNEAINEKQIYSPDKVFDYVRNRLITSLGKEEQKDGFDGILLCFNRTSGRITYAAANNTPILVRSGNVIDFDHDRMPVGQGGNENFRLFNMEWQPGDRLYLVTDGFADQFGGSKGKKFMKRSLKELLSNMSSRPFAEQRSLLGKTLKEWKGNNEQVDDVTVLGIGL